VMLFLGSIAIFHRQIMTVVYGVEYLPYSFILLAFCGIYVFVFLGTLLRFVIRTLEYNQLIFISYVLTTMFSLIAGKALASYYGLAGVMSGIAGTQLISFISFITLLKIKVKWNFKLFIFF
jgi:O-antigen/teichoic acid export membrane protein